MTGPRQRILFVAEAVTLAHVARPLVLAQALDPARYEIHFACDSRGMTMLADAPFQRWPIRTIATETFLARLQTGSPLYRREELEQYIACDRDLLTQIKPAIVVGDFRLSLAVAGPVAGVPYVNVTNAHWSPFAVHRRFPLPEHKLGDLLGPMLGQWVFDAIRPVAFRLHARSMDKLRRQRGLAPFGDLSGTYTWGDHVLYADVPELAPVRDAPATHHYVGPLAWSPPHAVPTWWEEVSVKPRPIYVTLGSSGHVKLLPEILAALADYPGQVIVATAGRVALTDQPSNARVAQYLPGEAAAARSAVVVCNGGSAPVYQALKQGTPVVGVASNMDQYLMMGAVVRAGAGVLVRAGQATGPKVRRAIDQVIGEANYQCAAQKLEATIRRYDTAAVFNHVLEIALSREAVT